jgi:hypothetical protein
MELKSHQIQRIIDTFIQEKLIGKVVKITKYRRNNVKYLRQKIGMKTQVIIIGIVALFMCAGLSGCNSLSSDKDKFVGTWKASNGVTSVLFSDGTCTVASVSGTWQIKDKMLVIVLANLPTQSTFSYAFSNDDKTVTLTEVATGISTVYTKQ